MKSNSIFIVIASLTAFYSCSPKVENPTMVDELPAVYPDYIDVTIPAGIAPLNFNMIDNQIDAVDVTLRGSIAGEMRVQGKYADFDIDDWHELTQMNKDSEIMVTVAARKDGTWTQYKDFAIHVSGYELNDYGLTYRLIPPGFEVGGNIGMYQRDIHTFDESPMMTETAVPERCMNCHTANRANPSRITMQVRHANGATFVQKDGRQYWYWTKTDSTKAHGSYAYWHPDGDYIAFSAAAVGQNFFVDKEKLIEVHHEWGNIVILDTRTNELILSEKLMTDDWVEIFPAFSADGRKLYYSSSPRVHVPSECDKVKCSIVSIDFDAASATFGETDTLVSGPNTNMSHVLVRPSYDGKWLMFVRCDHGNFPIQQPDADLWLMDLQTREIRALDIVNSSESDTHPNWSSDSRWFVFASKRDDGMYTRLFISSIDDDGNVTKPFVLPQRNPKKYYSLQFDAYNCPDFTTEKVDFDIRLAQERLYSTERINVTIRQ